MREEEQSVQQDSNHDEGRDEAGVASAETRDSVSQRLMREFRHEMRGEAHVGPAPTVSRDTLFSGGKHGAAASPADARTSGEVNVLVAEPEVMQLRVGDSKPQRVTSGGDGDVRVSASGDRVEVAGASRRGNWGGEVVGMAPGVDTLKAHADEGDRVETLTVPTIVKAPVVVAQDVRRVHAAGFEDTIANPVYEGDRVEMTLHLADVGADARLEGRLLTDGLLNATHSHYDPGTRQLTVSGVAARMGSASARVEIIAGARPPGVLGPATPLEVIPANPVTTAGTQLGVPPVATTSFEDAKDVLLAQVEQTMTFQRVGVSNAKTALLTKDKQAKLPFVARLLVALAESAFTYVTAGLSNAVGRWVGGKDAKTTFFDLDTAYSTTARERFKTLLAAGLGGDRGVLEEDTAIDLFCEEQANAVDLSIPDVKANLANRLDVFRRLEEETPGAGVSELERLRRGFAEVSEQARREQLFQTLQTWQLYRAQQSHGTVPRYGEEGRENAPEGTNLGAQGKGEIEILVTFDPSDPATAVTPVRVETSLRSETEREFLKLGAGRSIRDLGLPIRVNSALFSIGRNEIGDFWITLTKGVRDYGFAAPNKSEHGMRYLFEKAAGGVSWAHASEKEREASMHVGARRLVEDEVGSFELSSLGALATDLFGK